MLSQLGPYLIDEELAEGGMARVFRARLRGLGGFEKTLVIKQIKPELARDPRFVELFVREANTLVSLSHPHIVQVYELGAAEGTYYLSMEYVEGATVQRLLEQGPLAPALVAHLGAQISEALEYAHGRFGILHRDITPRNIIVDEAGHARLLDFGIAGSEGVTEELAFGSPGYMPPEQVERQSLSPQSDLFALGAVLYEALCARPALPKQADGSFSAAVLALPSELDPAWHTLLSSLLAVEPARRPSSAIEVARALRTLLARTSPHGALEEMQRRVREAKRAPVAATPTLSEETRLANTARIEARAIATSPVLSEILRSSAFAPIPKPPGQSASEPAGETRPLLRAPAPASRGSEGAEDQTSARLTHGMLRAWPLLSLLALVAALFGRSLLSPEQPSPAQRRATAQSAAPSGTTTPRASEPTPPSEVAPAWPARATQTGMVAASGPARAQGKPGMTAPTLPSANLQSSLSVNAKPWAELKLDGRALGVTPLRKLKLRAGTHVLVLSCPPLGRTATLKLDLRAAQSARVVVDLTQSPPRTVLDGVSEAR